MDLLTEDEEVVCHALEWTTQAHIRFAQAQLQAGAHATSMGDAYASSDLISPDMYRTFAHPYEKKVVEALAPTGKPYSVHICGDTSAIVGDMARWAPRSWSWTGRWTWARPGRRCPTPPC